MGETLIYYTLVIYSRTACCIKVHNRHAQNANAHLGDDSGGQQPVADGAIVARVRGVGRVIPKQPYVSTWDLEKENQILKSES